MNPNSPADPQQESASVTVQIVVEESWISRLVQREDWVLPVGDQYQLHQLQFRLEQDVLKLIGTIVGKPGSSIEVTSKPVWNSAHQQLILEDLQVQTRTRNILIKSAAWFASTFMQEKIDKRIEEYTRLLYQHHLERIRARPIEIPLAGNGMAKANVTSVFIRNMTFHPGHIRITATIDGVWALELK